MEQGAALSSLKSGSGESEINKEIPKPSVKHYLLLCVFDTKRRGEQIPTAGITRKPEMSLTARQEAVLKGLLIKLRIFWCFGNKRKERHGIKMDNKYFKPYKA